jgi:rhodanese-related sulfurtransferase
VPEIIEAFNKNDSEFKDSYGFEKPDKTVNLVVGCLAGKRGAAGAEQLKQIGFSTVR